MAVDRKYGSVTVEREPGNVLNGTDEPVFVIRARDFAAVSTLYDYQSNARFEGCGEDHIDMVNDTITDFEEWQKAHPKRLKIPD